MKDDFFYLQCIKVAPETANIAIYTPEDLNDILSDFFQKYERLMIKNMDRIQVMQASINRHPDKLIICKIYHNDNEFKSLRRIRGENKKVTGNLNGKMTECITIIDR